MIRRALTALFASLCLAALPGCADLRVGYVMDSAQAKEIQPYLTTRSQVRGLLGTPYRTHKVGSVDVEVHKRITKGSFKCVIVSYRGDKVMHVTQVR